MADQQTELVQARAALAAGVPMAKVEAMFAKRTGVSVEEATTALSQTDLSGVTSGVTTTADLPKAPGEGTVGVMKPGPRTDEEKAAAEEFQKTALKELEDAKAALAAGVDGDKVQKMLASRAGVSVEEASRALGVPTITTDQTKQAYEQATTPEVVRQLNSLPYSPVQAVGDAQYEEARPPTFMENVGGFADQFASSLTRSASGLLGAAGGVAPLLPYNLLRNLNSVPKTEGDSLQDAIFTGSDKLSQLSQHMATDTPKASEGSRMAGELAGAFVGGYTGDFAYKAQNIVREGGSLKDAELELAKGAATTEAYIGLGLLGPQAPGLMAMLGRAALQTPASVALTAADRKLSGEEMSKMDYMSAIGMGAGASVFRNPSKAEVAQQRGSSGDWAVDQGKAAGDRLLGNKPYDVAGAAERQKQLINERTLKEKTPKIDDMFGDKAMSAAKAETRRADLADPTKPAPARTKKEQAELELGYQFDQNLKAQIADEGKPTTVHADDAPLPIDTDVPPLDEAPVKKSRPKQGELGLDIPEENLEPARTAKDVLDDLERMNELNTKSKTKTLTTKEREERLALKKREEDDLPDSDTIDAFIKEQEAADRPLPNQPESKVNDADTAGLTPAERGDAQMVAAAAADWEKNGTKSGFFKRWFGDWGKEDRPSGLKGKNGSPLARFHATRAEEQYSVFDVHSGDFGSHVGSIDQASNFLRDPDGLTPRLRADTEKVLDYANHHGDRMIPLYVNIRNPLRMADNHWTNPRSVLKQLRDIADGVTDFRYAEADPAITKLPYLSPETRQRLTNSLDGNPMVQVLDATSNNITSQAGRREAFKGIADALEAAGFDGVVYKNAAEGWIGKDGKLVSEDSHIVFHPEQLKSSEGNRGTFDGPSIYHTLPETLGAISTAVEPGLEGAINRGGMTAKHAMSIAVKQAVGDSPLAIQSRNLLKAFAAIVKDSGANNTPIRRLKLDNPEHIALIESTNGGRPFDPKAALEFGAIYDPVGKQILMADGNNSLRTIVHEVAHAASAEVIHRGSKGELGPAAQKAYNNFNDLFLGLKDIALQHLKDTGRSDRALLTYGWENLHEFHSELWSNAPFRNLLREISVEPKAIQDKLPSWARGVENLKSLYDVVVHSLSDVLVKAGLKSATAITGTTKATNAFEVSLAAILDLHDKKGAGLKGGQPGGGKPLPSPVTGEKAHTSGRAFEPSRQGPLHKAFEALAGTKPGQAIGKTKEAIGATVPARAIKALLASDRGIDPTVRSAFAFVRNTTTAANYVKKAMGKGWLDVTKTLPLPERKRVKQLLDVIEKDSSTPKAAAAIKELGRVHPELGKTAQRFVQNRRVNSALLVRHIVSNPHATSEQMAQAAKIWAQRDSYITRSYKNFKEMKAQKEELKKAYAIDKDKRTPEQATLVETHEAAKDFVTKSILGMPETSTKMSSLEMQYRGLFGVDPVAKFAQMEKGVKRSMMIDQIQGKLSSIKDVDAQAAHLLDVMSSLTKDQNNSLRKYWRNLRTDSGILATKKNVPKELRDYWGEVSDPVIKMMNTVAVQSSHLAQLGALSELASVGSKSGIFSANYSNKHSAMLEGESLGPLQSLHTTPAIKQTIDSMVEGNALFSDILGGMIADGNAKNTMLRLAALTFTPLARLNSAAKTASVVGGVPGTFIRNLIGSPMQLFSNGNFSPKHSYQGIKDMIDAISIESHGKVNPRTELLYRLGLMEASQLKETFSPKAIKVMKALIKSTEDEGGGAKEFWGKVRTMQKNTAEAVKYGADSVESMGIVAKEIYGAMDLWTKLANFSHELEFRKKLWTRQGHYKDPKTLSKAKALDQQDRLERYVADMINDTNITPSRAPQIMHGSEALGTSRFGTYYTETIRTTKNNYGQAFLDIDQGLGTGDVALIAHGVKRLVGVTAASAYANKMFAGAIKGGAWALGAMGVTEATITDPEPARKEYLETDTFDKNGLPLVIKDGNQEYHMDVGFIPPLDPAWVLTKTAFTAASNPSKETAADFWDSVIDLTGKNAFLVKAGKAFNNREPTMSKKDPESYVKLLTGIRDYTGFNKNKADKVINMIEAFAPRGVLSTARAYVGDKDMSPLGKAMVASSIGIEKLEPMTSLQHYLGNGFNAQMKDVRRDFSDLVKSPLAARPGEIREAFKEAIPKAVKPYHELDVAVKAAQAQGYSLEEIRKVLKEGNVPVMVIGGLLSDEPILARIVYSDLKARSDSQKESELWARNKTELWNALEEFSDVPVDKLKEMK